jgi:hypothetical protein
MNLVIMDCLELVKLLKDKNPDNLTVIEQKTMHLLRRAGFLYIDFGIKGEDVPTIKCYTD